MKLFMTIAVAAFFGPLIVIAKEATQFEDAMQLEDLLEEDRATLRIPYNPITYVTLVDQKMGPMESLEITASTATEKTKEFLEKTLRENSQTFSTQIDLSASYGPVSGSVSTSFGFAGSQSSETSTAKSLAQKIGTQTKGTYKVPAGQVYMQIAEMKLYVFKQDGKRKYVRIPTGRSLAGVFTGGHVNNMFKDDSFNLLYQIKGAKPIKSFTTQQMANAVPDNLIKPAIARVIVRTRTWTGWTNSNQAGKLNPVLECAEGRYVTDLTWRNQWGYGFVNLHMKCSDGETSQSNSNRNGSWKTAMTCSKGFRAITGMEQSRYGIVNVKGFCLDKQTQITAGSNYDGKWKTELKCPKNQNIVGVQVREQSGYGIINFRIRCA